MDIFEDKKSFKVLLNPQFSTAEKNSWDHIILSLSKLHKELPTELHSLQKKLDSALEMRR